MGKSYSKYGEITTRCTQDPPDRLAARERARYVERKRRAQKQSNNPFLRHMDQIFLGWNVSILQQRRIRRFKQILLFAILLIVLLIALAACFLVIA